MCGQLAIRARHLLQARRGLCQDVTTNQYSRDMACARANLERLGVAAQVDLLHWYMFSHGKA